MVHQNEWTCTSKSLEALSVGTKDEHGRPWELFYDRAELEAGNLLFYGHKPPAGVDDPDYPGDADGELKVIREKTEDFLKRHYFPKEKRAA